MKNIHASDTKNNFTTLVKTEAREHCVKATLWPGRFVSSIACLTNSTDYSTPTGDLELYLDHQLPYTEIVSHQTPPIAIWPSAFEYSSASKNRLNKNKIGRNKIYPHQSPKLRGTNPLQGKGTDKFKINISGGPSDFVVGIKFVNIFSGFLFQISNTQGQTVSVQIFDDGVSIDNYVTARKVLVEAKRSNEPSVLCQSTFN